MDLESKLLLREVAVMEPATALTASQNYRGGRGGGRQGIRAAADSHLPAAGRALMSGIVQLVKSVRK